MNCLHLSFTGCGHPGCKRWGNDCESALAVPSRSTGALGASPQGPDQRQTRDKALNL